jgi:seryl-tRNA synthetase
VVPRAIDDKSEVKNHKKRVKVKLVKRKPRRVETEQKVEEEEETPQLDIEALQAKVERDSRLLAKRREESKLAQRRLEASVKQLEDEIQDLEMKMRRVEEDIDKELSRVKIKSYTEADESGVGETSTSDSGMVITEMRKQFDEGLRKKVEKSDDRRNSGDTE